MTSQVARPENVRIRRLVFFYIFLSVVLLIYGIGFWPFW